VAGFDKSRTKRIGKSTTLSVRTFVRVRIIELEELLMNKLVVRFVKDESGATAIEYGLIAAGISVAIIAVVQGLGTNLKNTFQSVSTALK
jgi:pilus assembly protein Flp/PilA